jgi:molybdopterin synthase catalytic subunit
MNVRVRFFAATRDIVGQRELDLELSGTPTVSILLEELMRRYPELARIVSSVRVAVNREYAEATQALAENDEVALIPPVSGGLDLYEITEAPLSMDALARAVGQHTSGAIASFLGIVREYARGRRVVYLEYDAYPEMAVAKMREIGEEIRGRWQVDRIAVVHRVGRLGIGEASVAIAIASPHRHEALDACAYAIERLKAVVPIWKKEVWADGAEWIGSTVDEYWSNDQFPTTNGGASTRPLAIGNWDFCG